jgi:hypothetical protein
LYLKNQLRPHNVVKRPSKDNMDEAMYRTN